MKATLGPSMSLCIRGATRGSILWSWLLRAERGLEPVYPQEGRCCLYLRAVNWNGSRVNKKATSKQQSKTNLLLPTEVHCQVLSST